jgi:arsenite methyltransferase
MGALQLLGLSEKNISLHTHSEAQEQTKDTFAFKWAKRDTYESEEVKKNAYQWLLERYCKGTEHNLQTILAEGNTEKIILDAGCGSGFSGLLLFNEHLKKHHYLGVDISDAVWLAKTRFEEAGISADFVKSSLMNLDFIPNESIDIIFSEGVLHHTDSTELSLKYLATKIKKGGLFMFYVYAQKAPIREFTDDYVREQLRSLSDEEAWEKLKPLTDLGTKLGQLGIQLTIDQNVDVLGIKKGTYDLQRFFYWNICKMYYRPEYSAEEMNHVNFDWFRPLNCQRHTPEQIRTWCQEAKLDIEHINIQEAGITVIARKK